MASVSALDLAKLGETPLDKRLRYYAALQSPLLGDASIQIIDTFRETYTRHVENYGQPSFGSLGVGFTSIVSKPEQLTCEVFRLGFNVDIDRDLKQGNQIEDPRVEQLKAGMMGYSAYLSGKLLTASPDTPSTDVSGNPAETFKGLYWYLDFPDDPEGAKLSSEMKFSASSVNANAVIDLRPPVSSANARAFMRALNTMRYKHYHAYTAKKKITVYVPSEIMIGLPDIQLVSGALKTTADAWGREMYTYGDMIEIKDAGLAAPVRNPLDPTTSVNRVMGWEDVNGIRNNTLVSGSSGGQYVSMVGVEWGDDALILASKGGQQQIDLGLLDDGVTKRTQVSDVLGFKLYNPWCISRCYGLQIG